MKKSIISRKNLFLLLGIFLLGIAINFSNIVNALTLNQVMQRSPAFHLLKDIYTVINGEYIPVNTSSGKINSSLIEITEDLDMNGYDINNVNQFNANSISANEICLGGDCKTSWPSNTAPSGIGAWYYKYCCYHAACDWVYYHTCTATVKCPPGAKGVMVSNWGRAFVGEIYCDQRYIPYNVKMNVNTLAGVFAAYSYKAPKPESDSAYRNCLAEGAAGIYCICTENCKIAKLTDKFYNIHGLTRDEVNAIISKDYPSYHWCTPEELGSTGNPEYLYVDTIPGSGGYYLDTNFDKNDCGAVDQNSLKYQIFCGGLFYWVEKDSDVDTRLWICPD